MFGSHIVETTLARGYSKVNKKKQKIVDYLNTRDKVASDMEMNTPTLREQLEPLAADLEKAREVINRAGKIVSDHAKTGSVSFGLDYRENEKSTGFWVSVGYGDNESGFFALLDTVIIFVASYSPANTKSARIAKLKAELAELEGE